MKMRLSVLAALVLAVSAMGQVSTSRLEGVIQDASGAIVPGAKVEAVNTKTSISATAKSDGQGRYMFQSIAPGAYSLSVEAAGFRKAVLNDLTLNVGDTVTQNVSLEVGSVVETVMVESNTLRVQTA